MNPTFNITSPSTLAKNIQIFLQVSNYQLALIKFDRDTNTFFALQIFQFKNIITDKDSLAQLKNIVQDSMLFNTSVTKILVHYFFDENILVPHKYFDISTANDMWQMVYGDIQTAPIQHQFVEKQNVHIVYKISNEIKNIFNQFFPSCTYRHQCAALLNYYQSDDDLLYCNFYHNNFTLFLKTAGQIQIIKNFCFATPSDVLYHLLNVCQCYAVDASQTVLMASGMIEIDANLYDELYKYFFKIEFTNLPDNFNYTEEIKKYPTHYFSNLFATATCEL